MVRSSIVVVSDDQNLVQNAQQFGQAHGVSVQVMSPEAFERLKTPGQSLGLVPGQTGAVEGAKILAFPGNTASGSGDKKSVTTINHLESVAIENAIAAFRGNLTEAAKALGIGRATLYRKVKQYNIDPSASRKKKAA